MKISTFHILRRHGLRLDRMWNVDLPLGPYRYYPGLMALFSFLIVSGQMQVW